ncbi:winged helix-turn-helix transcriptional regulator [Weissella uvarum]|nr:winged helix-turn-helix transcriptional regulator [Weissella uvarum]
MKEILDALEIAEKQYRAELVKMAKKVNLTVAEWTLLAVLADGFDTQDQLSTEMHLDNSTLSRQLKSLLKKEMVASEATNHDNRQLRYMLTDAGKTALDELDNQKMAFNTRVFSVWSDEEKRMIEILLNRLEKSLTKSA